MIRAVEIRVYVHATEDREKVLRAVETIIPKDIQASSIITEEEFQGHYGNPIRVITIKLEDPSIAKSVLEGLLYRLSNVDKEYIIDSLEERVDRYGALHLRVNKQDAFQGKLTIHESDDVIKITIHYTGGRRRAIREYRELIEASRH